VSLFAAIPADADSVYVTAWQVVFNQNQGSMTFWTFNAGSGLQGPAPVDPNPVDIAYGGYAPPLAIEDSFAGGVNTYYATYGRFSPGTAFAPGEVLNTFSGYMNLTDESGFVAGLPFECTGTCTNVIFRPNIGVEEFDWMNSSLDSSTIVDAPITGTATLTVREPQPSDPISGSALMSVNPTPTPTPEPSSLLLLGAGIVTIMSLSRKHSSTDPTIQTA
jgi:hypothetical protein